MNKKFKNYFKFGENINLLKWTENILYEVYFWKSLYIWVLCMKMIESRDRINWYLEFSFGYLWSLVILIVMIFS